MKNFLSKFLSLTSLSNKQIVNNDKDGSEQYVYLIRQKIAIEYNWNLTIRFFTETQGQLQRMGSFFHDHNVSKTMHNPIKLPNYGLGILNHGYYVNRTYENTNLVNKILKLDARILRFSIKHNTVVQKLNAIGKIHE